MLVKFQNEIDGCIVLPCIFNAVSICQVISDQKNLVFEIDDDIRRVLVILHIGRVRKHYYEVYENITYYTK